VRAQAVQFLRALLTGALIAAGAGCAGAQGDREPTTPRAKPVLVDYGAEPVSGDPSAWYPGATYDEAIATPEQCLGYPLGSRIARPEAIVACFRTWAEQSSRAVVERYAVSYEGRELVRVVITTPENHARLDEILANIDKLANPRAATAAEVDRIAESSPAVAWLGYSIHGDETSGADASLAFGHYLIAGTDERVGKILADTVVVLDPVMNPDGRTRIIEQVGQLNGVSQSLNFRGMGRGYWPWGRGNHYLFDMNRDWIVGTQPETRGRWQSLLRFRPQLFVDAHEMGPNDTYLFYPRAEPVNRNFAATHAEWSKVFAADQGAAFDRYGWPYYTREWADGWYPGYSDAWGSLLGSIGILYEQAKVWGRPLRKHTGQIVTYRETVHAQAQSSLANVRTLLNNRAALLRDFAAYHRQAAAGPAKTFVINPGVVPDRERHLVEVLLRQGIEVWRADQAFSARAVSPLGDTGRVEVPKGAYLIDAAQPRGGLVRAILEFDPRFSKEVLAKERRGLEQKNESGLYDVTAWNLGMTYGLDVAWIDTPSASRSQVRSLEATESGVEAGKGAVAWAVHGADDASVVFAGLALEAGLVVHASDRPFTVGDEEFPRGSLLVRAIDNPTNLAERLGRAATDAGVRAVPISTSRSPDEGPDLGGLHFRLLRRPRVAIVTNTPIRPDAYGHVWFHIDQHLRLPVTLLDAHRLGREDLRRYNVVVVPATMDPTPLLAAAPNLTTWVRSGGTLVAMGTSASVLSAKGGDLTSVRRRRDALADLPAYARSIQRWLASRDVAIDEDAVWGDQATQTRKPAKATDGDKGKGKGGPSFPGGEAGERARAAEDAWMRRFSPVGAMARGLVDQTHWITAGARAAMPVFVAGSTAFIAPDGVTVPVRLAAADKLRLSGLLWPEARARLEKTAWATVESRGAGQVILFSVSPVFRGQHPGAARFLSNAVVFGPSLGARQPQEW